MKNKVIGVILIVVLLVLAVFAIHSALSSRKGDFVDEGDSYNQDIVLVNTNFPTDIVIFGEDIYFRPAVKYRRIDKITRESLAYDADKFHRLVLVISDLGSTVQLEEEDYKIIKELLDADMIDYYYFGTSKVEDIIKYQLWEVRTITDGQIYGFGVGKYYNGKVQFTLFDKSDAEAAAVNKEYLGQIIIFQIARCIRSNN